MVEITNKECQQLQLRLKELEAEVCRLREAESKLNGILASMVDLVFGFDNDGRFIYYHSPDENLLYVPPQKFIGKKYSEVMPPQVNELLRAAFEKNRKKAIAEFDYSLEMEGETRYFSAKLSPILFNEVYSGSVAVVRDITERRRMKKTIDHRPKTIDLPAA